MMRFAMELHTPFSPALIPGGIWRKDISRYLSFLFSQHAELSLLHLHSLLCCFSDLVCDRSVFTSISLSFEFGILVYLRSFSFNLY